MGKIVTFCLALVIASALLETTLCAVNIVDIYRNVVFDYAVMRNPKPVVVFYYSSRACLWSIKPMLERMAKKKNDKIYLALVDFDKVPDLQANHGINEIPTTRVLFKGQIMDEVAGLSWAKLVPLVNQAAKIE